MHYIQNARGPTSQLLDPTRSLKILRPMTLRMNPQKLWGIHIYLAAPHTKLAWLWLWLWHGMTGGNIFIHADRMTMAWWIQFGICIYMHIATEDYLRHERRSNWETHTILFINHFAISHSSWMVAQLAHLSSSAHKIMSTPHILGMKN